MDVSLIHGISGYVVFVAGLLQYLLKKGTKTHRIIGKAYLLTWFVLVASGAAVGGLLITFLGLFGLYYAISGTRFAMVKAPPKTLFDKILVITGLLCAISICVSAIYFLTKGNVNFGVIFSVFGLIFGVNVTKDVLSLFTQKNYHQLSGNKMQWYFEHYTRYTISFIAALTAFSAIQNITGIVVVNWLLPTVLGTGYLFLMGKKHRKQFRIKTQ